MQRILNIEEVLGAIKETAGADKSVANTLPPAAYASVDLWNLEQERILRKEWYCVGRETDFENPGDYFSLDILGEPVLVWRGRDEKLRAFTGVCRHRNAILIGEESTGNKKVIACPYHCWSYNPDGTLRGAPNTPPDFDKSKICLPEYPLETWQGFVFVSLDPSAGSLAPRLESMLELIGDTRMDEYSFSMRVPTKTLRANWKIMVENGMDGYHIAYVHPKTLGRNIVRVDSPWGDSQWNTSCEKRKQAWDDYDDDPPGLTQMSKENTYTIGIFPLLLFSLDCHCLIWYSIFPTAHGESAVRTGVAARTEDKLCPVGAPDSMTTKAYGEWVTQLLSEDSPIVESIQRSMQTPYATQGRLMPGLEDNLHFFYRYLASQLGA